MQTIILDHTSGAEALARHNQGKHFKEIFTIKEDINIYRGQAFAVIYPVTDKGRRWIAKNINADASRINGAVAAEYPYLDDILEGMKVDGLTVLQ